MKFLMAAFGITLGTSLAIYGGLRLFAGLEGEAVFSVAAFPFLASGHIYEVLERRAAKEELKSEPNLLVTFPEFGFPWYRLLILSVLLFLGSVEASAAYTAIITTLMDTPLKFSVAGLIELPVNAALAFMIGRWLGTRCRSVLLAMALFMLAVTLCMILDRVVAIQMYSDVGGDEDPAAVFGRIGSLQFFELLSIGASIYSVIGCLGLWRGSRLREERYTSYLLKLMPRSSRLTLISLARDEVEAIVRKHHMPVA